MVHAQLALCMETPTSFLLFQANLGSQKLVALPTVFYDVALREDNEV